MGGARHVPHASYRPTHPDPSTHARDDSWPAPDAYASLLLLLGSSGRIEEGTRVVFDLIRASPRPASYIAVSETLKVMGDERGAKYWAQQGAHKFPDNRDLHAMVTQ
jgi:hypothetical protein